MLLISLTFHYIIFALAIICTLRSILHHLTIQNNLHSLCQYLLISSYIYTPITSTYVTLKICFPYFCVEVSFSQLISHKISRYPTPYMYFHTQFKPNVVYQHVAHIIMWPISKHIQNSFVRNRALSLFINII